MGHLVHIASIVGVFVCAHHFWPKGMLYGEREEYEKEYRRRHTHPDRFRKPSSKLGNNSRDSSRDEDGYAYPRREREQGRRERERYEYEASARPMRDIEYGAHPVYSRHARLRDYEYEYEEAPAYSRRASSRY